jgi:5-methylcytosine-specific restriction endonuclease McrA
MSRNVLLLNSSEEVLRVIGWKRAVKLLQSGKAKKPFNYNKSYSIRTTSGEYNLPAAIVLVRYVYLPYSDDVVSPTRTNIFKRDKYTCQYCGYSSKNPKNLTIDHVHPRCRGGGTQWTNLTTACPDCNIKKGNKLLKDSGMKLSKKPFKPKKLALQMVGVDYDGKMLWERWIHI